MVQHPRRMTLQPPRPPPKLQEVAGQQAQAVRHSLRRRWRPPAAVLLTAAAGRVPAAGLPGSMRRPSRTGDLPAPVRKAVGKAVRKKEINTGKDNWRQAV